MRGVCAARRAGAPQPQNEYIEEAVRRHGRRLDHEERLYACAAGWRMWPCRRAHSGCSHVWGPGPPPSRRKKEARSVHKRSEFAQKVHGLRAKLYNKQRHNEKIQMKKTYAAAAAAAAVALALAPPRSDV